MRRLFKCMMWGFIAILLLGSPIILSCLAYKLFLHFVTDALLRGRLSILVGYLWLLLWPMFVLGLSLQRSREKPAPFATDHADTSVLMHSELIDVWKTCVDVQKHFNDIELQIRNYAVTLMVAVIGASAYALKENMMVTLWGFKYSLAIAVLPAGMIGWLAFYFMDRLWYHRLLMGSVRHTLRVEKMLEPELGLSGAIGKESAIPIKCLKMDIHSSEKIDIFYFAGLMLFIMMTGIALMGATSATAPETAPIAIQTGAEVNAKPTTIGPAKTPAPLGDKTP
jgi:hypothetical protein